LHLTAWAELGGGAMKRRMTVSEETRKGLLMVLLRIYMGQGEGSVHFKPYNTSISTVLLRSFGGTLTIVLAFGIGLQRLIAQLSYLTIKRSISTSRT
jgi:hypothetical protein